MALMSQLFSELPELFAIVEELQHYSRQMAIQVDTMDTDGIPLPRNADYPIIALTAAALEQTLETLPTISHNFMILMMKKHR